MPVFRFNKAFGIARDLKVFLHLRGGVTRGAVPEVDPYKKQAQKLRNARQKDRQLIKEQRKKIKEQAKTLGYARRRMNEIKNNSVQKQEIFRLKNELRAAEERVENATKGRPAWQAEGEPKTGALPDFLIIGAWKAGTTSLYNLLTRHPHVEGATTKELHYFDDKNFDKGIEWYRSQFPSPRSKDGRRSITGEASAGYLFHRSVPERVAKVLPQARLIVLLRNPVDRAYSHYHHWVRTLRETRRFEEVIEAEKEWLLAEEEEAPEQELLANAGRRPFSYLERSIYVDQLLRWSRFYGEDQMLVLKSEDFFERTPETLKYILHFLDLPDWEPEAVEIRNKGRYEREMDPVTRQRLEDFFKPHNRRLYEYLGVDFGW